MANQKKFDGDKPNIQINHIVNKNTIIQEINFLVRPIGLDGKEKHQNKKHKKIGVRLLKFIAWMLKAIKVVS